MANKDKNITNLNDTGRMIKKIRDQAETIKTLRERLKAYELGAAETSRLLDSILAEVANTFGEAAEDDSRSVTLPLVSVRRNTRDYEVHTEVNKENNGYVITARRRGTHSGN